MPHCCRPGSSSLQAGGRFRFKHALLCDIAYETLLTPRRQKLHQRIAEALEAMPANLAEREPESLARHWFAAGQNGRGEAYWLRARHRVAHWQEQLDALADYLDADGAEMIPIQGRPGSANFIRSKELPEAPCCLTTRLLGYPAEMIWI